MLFGPNATMATRKKGYEVLQIWKVRRGPETSASILSTIAILEVQLRDDESNQRSSTADLQSMYSGAITRFVNYAMSVEQKQQRKKSMYSIANKLGFDPTIIDTRHQCAHGMDLPSLDVLRKHASAGMTWLKSFYWDRELKYIQDTDVNSLKIHNTVRFERNLKRLLLLYDIITEGIHKDCKQVQEVYDVVSDVQRTIILRDYVAQLNEQNILKVFNCVVTDLLMASKSRVVKECTHIFAKQLLECPYFIESSCKLSFVNKL